MIIRNFKDFNPINEEFIDKVEFRFKQEEIEDFLMLLLDSGFKYEDDSGDDDDDDDLPMDEDDFDPTAFQRAKKTPAEKYIIKGIYSGEKFIPTRNAAGYAAGSNKFDDIELAYRVELYRKVLLSDMSAVLNKVLKDIESNKSKLLKVNTELVYDFSIVDDEDYDDDDEYRYDARRGAKNKKKEIRLEFIFIDKQPLKDDTIKKSIYSKRLGQFIENLLDDLGLNDDDLLSLANDSGKVIITCDRKDRNLLYNIFSHISYFSKFKKSDAKKEVLNSVKTIYKEDPEYVRDNFGSYGDEDLDLEDVASNFNAMLEFELTTYPLSSLGSEISSNINDKWMDISDNEDENDEMSFYDMYDAFNTWEYGDYVILEPSNSEKIGKKLLRDFNKVLDACENDWNNNRISVEVTASTEKFILLRAKKTT